MAKQGKRVPMPRAEELEGLTYEEAAEKFSVSRSTLYGWKCKLGARMKLGKMGPKPKPSPPKEEIDGISIRSISSKYRVNPKVAARWRRETGAAPPPLGDKVKTARQKRIDKRNNRMVAAMKYMKDAELSRAFNITRERVRQIRNKHGITMEI